MHSGNCADDPMSWRAFLVAESNKLIIPREISAELQYRESALTGLPSAVDSDEIMT